MKFNRKFHGDHPDMSSTNIASRHKIIVEILSSTVGAGAGDSITNTNTVSVGIVGVSVGFTLCDRVLVIVGVGSSVGVGLGLSVGRSVGVGDAGRHVRGGRPDISHVDGDGSPMCRYPGQTRSQAYKYFTTLHKEIFFYQKGWGWWRRVKQSWD